MLVPKPSLTVAPHYAHTLLPLSLRVSLLPLHLTLTLPQPASQQQQLEFPLTQQAQQPTSQQQQQLEFLLTQRAQQPTSQQQQLQVPLTQQAQQAQQLTRWLCSWKACRLLQRHTAAWAAWVR